MFYLDLGLESILHVDNFLVLCGLLSIASETSPFWDCKVTPPRPSLRGVGVSEGVGAAPTGSFSERLPSTLRAYLLLLPSTLPPCP